MNSRLASFAFASVLALVTGCNLDTETDGTKGVEEFSYSSSQCGLLGCGLDKPTLQGSRITIMASGGDTSLRPTAKLAHGNVGSIASQSETCSCAQDNNTRSLDQPSDSCRSGETKSCSLSIDIETTTAGDDTLEIHEPSGALRDSISFHVRAASRIDTTLSDSGNPLLAVNGVYNTHMGAALQLHSDVYDSANQPLVFSEHGLSFAYADKTLLAPNTNVILAATDDEYMSPLGPGDTQVVDSAAGASVTLKLHITP